MFNLNLNDFDNHFNQTEIMILWHRTDFKWEVFTTELKSWMS